LLLGGQVTLAQHWHVGLAASSGLTPGIGTPQFRVISRVEYIPAVLPPPPPPPPLPPPPPPPPSDRDKDGIIDREDACPDDPGVKTDDPTTNGCPPPPPDRDKDGILDSEDACPDTAGMKTDDPRTNGCADRDGDSILDPIDACPDVPGIQHPDPKKHGCPLVRIERKQIRILEQIKFKFDSAQILPESSTILNAVAGILKEHPDIQQVRVEGHTDNQGKPIYNRGLSRRRAASVVKWLVKREGIEASRLTSEGFGQSRPIDSNSTEEGRKENRRVEFHIASVALPEQ
jgi:outer membrane protein OmpA-like peptidoglycan-associated protein